MQVQMLTTSAGYRLCVQAGVPEIAFNSLKQAQGSHDINKLNADN